MKKLLLLSAIFIFTFGFGQNSDTFNFDDIRKLSSDKLFKKFCFENEFSNVKSTYSYLMYAKGYDSDKETANIWAYYYYIDNTFLMQFFRKYNGSANQSFQNILNQVKKLCKFYDFYNYIGTEYICYSCTNSSYKGKIGFFRDKEGTDTIRTFDF